MLAPLQLQGCPDLFTSCLVEDNWYVTSSLSLGSSLMLSLCLAGDVPLPFTPEEHVRCNCNMFEDLQRWLHEISQDTFRILLQKHLQKKGTLTCIVSCAEWYESADACLKA